MPFNNFVPQNNAQGTLLAWISSVATTMILQSWQGGRFPSTFPYLCEIKQVDTVSPFAVLKREIVKVTGRTGDTLTIVRSSGTCLPSDASNTPGTTAYAFASGDTVTLTVTAETIKDIQDELALKMNRIGWLWEDYGANKVKEIDPTSGDEVLRDLSTGSSIASTDLLQKIDPSTRARTEIPFSVLQWSLGNSFTEDLVYESIISAWDIVWTLPDGTFKLQATEVKTSTAIGTATLLSSCVVWPMKYFIVYLASGAVYGRIMQVNADDSVTYWTATSIVSLATPSAKCALVDTNKVVVTYCDTASVTSTSYSSVIGTISTNSVSFGTAFSESFWSGWSTSWTVASVVKVRSDAYAVVYERGTFNGASVRVNSISWTSISAGTTIANYIFWFQNNSTSMCYLSDNTIAVVEWVTTSNQYVRRIYAITPGNTTVATTYTISSTTATTSPVNICRYSNTAFIETHPSNTWVKIYSIPWVWTTLDVTTLTANAWNWYTPISIWDFVYAMSTGTTIRVMQRDVLIATISWTSAIYGAQGQTYYSNGRIVSWSWATLIPNIVNITHGFVSWIATESPKLAPIWVVVSKSWGKKWTRSYITWGVLSSDTSSTEQMWFWLSDSTLMML